MPGINMRDPKLDTDIDFGIPVRLIGLLSLFLAGTGIDFPRSIKESDFDDETAKKLTLLWTLYTDRNIDYPSKDAKLLGSYFSIITHMIYSIGDKVTDVMTGYTESCVEDVGNGEITEAELLSKSGKVKNTYEVIKAINRIHKLQLGMSNFRIINRNDTDILVCDLCEDNGVVYNCIDCREEEVIVV